ncbi:glycoside hydrolase [Thozetella sp. PMI_491]|nr:glycoside hydrolase [Thozetella sp. PMI_491]
MMKTNLSILASLAGLLTTSSCQQPPFYGSSASGKTSAARGWNSFIAQSNGEALTVALMDQQCEFFYGKAQAGFDYVCSFDSGWSVGGNGDDNGRLIPDPSVFSTMSIQDFAAKLHQNGMKLGVYALPGAFVADANKLVEGTNIKIGSLFNTTVDSRPGINNAYNARNDFNYGLPGVQEWHDSVVRLFNSFGVDFIKLDYITPGSDLNPSSSGDPKPANDSPAVVAFHNAIMKINPNIRLDISWGLDRDQPFWTTWRSNADTLRLDRDINFGKNPVSWGPIQRTLEQYREFINQQVLDSTRQGLPIMIRPDMDSLVSAAPSSASSWSGLSTIERYGQTILWLGAGANLIQGADMTKVDSLGNTLLTNPEVLDIAAFTANFPMVPKLPGTQPTQLQAWVAGPSTDGGEAVVVLTNLGPDICWDGCSFNANIQGDQLVTATLNQLGLGGSSWFVRRVLGGGGRGGPDFSDIGVTSTQLASFLSEHESVMYKLTKCGTAGSKC